MGERLETKVGKTIDGEEYRLRDHLLDVGITAEYLAERFQCFSPVPGLSLLGGTIHDVGKASRSFQEKIRSGRGSTDHVTVNAVLLDLLRDEFEEFLPPNPDAFLQVGLGHHGTPLPFLKYPGRKRKDELSEQDVEWIRQFGEKFLPEIAETLDEDWEKSSRIINGLITVGDWLASSRSFLTKAREVSVEAFEDYRTNIRNVLGELLEEPVEAEAVSSFEDLFDFDPRPVQALVDELPVHEDGLYVIEALTGSGKTEAALTLAGKLMAQFDLDLYFALPTRATTNSMARRFQEDEVPEALFGTDVDLSVAHSKREVFYSDEAGRRTGFFGESLKTSLLQSFSIGTIDQAVLSVLPVTHCTLRHLGLSRSVLIVDEVHDYDPYLNGLLKKLIGYRRERSLPTILLSATLSNRQRSEFVRAYGGAGEAKANRDFPRITAIASEEVRTHAFEGFEEKNVEVRWIHSVDEAAQLVTDHERSAWLRNTVDDAREAFSSIDVDAQLLHSRFTVGDRERLETTLLNGYGPDGDRSSARPVIGTQVLEQSLDVDFDVMVTDLAPMDRLIQRCGRLHRHDRGRSEPPVLYVLAPEFEKDPDEDWYSSVLPGASYVYADHARLWKTMKALRENGNKLKMPEDNRDLIESTYELETPSGLQGVEDEVMGERMASADTARFNVLDLDSPYGAFNDRSDYWDTNTMTRLGSGVTEVQFLTGDGSYLNKNSHRSTISLSHHLTGGEIVEADDTAADGTQQVFLETSEESYRGSIVTEEGSKDLHYSHETGLTLS